MNWVKIAIYVTFLTSEFEEFLENMVLKIGNHSFEEIESNLAISYCLL